MSRPVLRQTVFAQVLMGWNRPQLAAILLAIAKMIHSDVGSAFLAYHDHDSWRSQEFPLFLFLSGAEKDLKKTVNGFEAIDLAQDQATGSLDACRILLLWAIRRTFAARALLFTAQKFSSRLGISYPPPTPAQVAGFFDFLFPRLGFLAIDDGYQHVKEFLEYCREMAILGTTMNQSNRFALT